MKTIEIASKLKGNINICTKRQEQRTVTFEDKDGVGVAKVDEDEAEVFLSLPGYWKVGATAENAVEAAVAALTGEAAEEATAIKRGRKKQE